jgi:hypothetical protein
LATWHMGQIAGKDATASSARRHDGTTQDSA